MVDRILDYRLGDEFDGGTILQLLGDRDGEIEFVLIPHLLDVQIVLHMLQFFSNSDDFTTLADADSKETGKGRHHFHDIFGVALFSQPYH